MVLFEGALATLAYVSVIVATLRAGSRALYLTEHHSIGVMQGPPILGPHEVSNRSDASTVWDLSYPFQEGVRLALFPQSFQYEQDEIVERELYTMSAHPAIDVTHEKKQSIDGLDQEEVEYFDELVDQVIAENDKTSVFRRYAEAGQRSLLASWSKIEGTVSPRLATTKEWILSQRLATTKEWIQLKQWKTPAWLGFKKVVVVEEEEDDEDDWDDDEEDWDYLSSRSSDLEFNNTAGDNVTARITAHAPDTFADLRARFGLSERDFQTSMLESGPYVSFQSNSKGAARAGGVFFFTRDGGYMVKTIKKEEAKTLLEMLPKYHKHMGHNGRRSLLTRFCGMYTVKTTEPSNGFVAGATKEQEYVFVIMNSVFPAEGSQFISERYDLKGSTVGRECSEEEKTKKGSNAVLKDMDLAKEVELVRSMDRPFRRASGYGFHLGEFTKAALLSQLRRDVKLLVECKVMDYSLLVGVANMDTGRFDFSTLEALDKSQAYETAFRHHSRRNRRAKKFRRTLVKAMVPFQIMGAPIVYFGRRVISIADRTVSSVLTLPLPYYGAGLCSVDGGTLAMVDGTRTGKRAIYYLGLIDFLQPWTVRKVVERQLKGWMGYDVHAVSCVAPEEYAARFLEFLDSHIS